MTEESPENVEFFVDHEGSYMGEFPAAPEGGIAVPCPPENADEQLWTGKNWRWKIHYYRDAAGNYLGAADLPSKPEGGIEVDPNNLPDHGLMKWNGEAWEHTPEFLAEQNKAEIVAELAALDADLPRAVEDMWQAMGFDTSTLPQIQQDRLARKIALRAQLAALAG